MLDSAERVTPGVARAVRQVDHRAAAGRRLACWARCPNTRLGSQNPGNGPTCQAPCPPSEKRAPTNCHCGHIATSGRAESAILVTSCAYRAWRAMRSPTRQAPSHASSMPTKGACRAWQRKLDVRIAAFKPTICLLTDRRAELRATLYRAATLQRCAARHRRGVPETPRPQTPRPQTRGQADSDGKTAAHPRTPRWIKLQTRTQKNVVTGAPEKPPGRPHTTIRRPRS
jgi:hypothetical protein